MYIYISRFILATHTRIVHSLNIKRLNHVFSSHLFYNLATALYF